MFIPLQYPLFPDYISHTISNGLLLQHCHASPSVLCGLASYTHRQYGLRSHLSHHIAYVMGIPPFYQYGIWSSLFPNSLKSSMKRI